MLSVSFLISDQHAASFSKNPSTKQDLNIACALPPPAATRCPVHHASSQDICAVRSPGCAHGLYPPDDGLCGAALPGRPAPGQQPLRAAVLHSNGQAASEKAKWRPAAAHHEELLRPCAAQPLRQDFCGNLPCLKHQEGRRGGGTFWSWADKENLLIKHWRTLGWILPN